MVGPRTQFWCICYLIPHFRVRSLKAVGAWDPFNVTEDADLGVRLARLGYRTETLPLPTAEEAPARLMPWLRQRTRWFKGWMQTWLVHTRHPWRLARDLGWRRFIAFNLICTGIVVSSIIYPLYLLSLASVLLHPGDLFGDHGPLAAALKGINVFNLCAGYLAMVLLAGRALRLRGRDADVRGLFYLPVYWFLMSVASYRALWQLVSRPHHWEKTAHRRRNGGFRRVPRAE